jgi:hypothetical protein
MNIGIRKTVILVEHARFFRFPIAAPFFARAIALCILLVTGMAEEDGITVIQVIGHA